MGISIISGSATTVLAVIVLFICVIVIFMKFAIFVISTIFFAVIYSLGFFCSLCLVVGPNGKFGDIGNMVTTTMEWIKFQQKFYEKRTVEQKAHIKQQRVDFKNE